MPAPPDAAHGHASTRNTTLLLLLPLLALTALTVMSVAALQQPAHPHDAQQPHLLLLHGTLHHEQYIPYHSTSTHIQRRRRAHELQQQVPQIIGATQVLRGMVLCMQLCGEIGGNVECLFNYSAHHPLTLTRTGRHISITRHTT